MIAIDAIGPSRYADYAAISPAFTVSAILECLPVAGGLGGLLLRERPVLVPYGKYEHEEVPADWARCYDLSSWGLYLATDGGRPVGGAAVAPPLEGMLASQGRSDVAVLWDLRVAPPERGRGVGRALFLASAAWARERGYRTLSIETQNANLPACRFYARMGCELAEVRRFGYAACPPVAHEALLIWQVAL
jgi:GNAT superfamily N-acetyltransferase